MRSLFPVALFLLFITGCTFNQAMLIAPGDIGPKEKAIQMVEGSSYGFYLLFLGPFGDHSLNAAVKDALSKTQNDSLVNVFVDKSVMSFGIFSIVETKIFGTAVRYLEMPEKSRDIRMESHPPPTRWEYDNRSKSTVPATSHE